MRYSNIGKEKENGVVYTPAAMADYVAKEIANYSTSFPDPEITILDPAVGTGELLIALIKTIGKHKKRIKAVGYETDETVGKETQKKLRKLFPRVDIEIRISSFLDAAEKGAVGKYDCIIANPPYIRTQIMGSSRAQAIAQKLSLSGRIDIYYAFLLYARDILKPTGVAGFIVSNKFLTIKAGSAVRNYMVQNYTLHHITDLGDTKLFNAAILPCIIIFSLGQTVNAEAVDFTSVYQVNEAGGVTIQNIFDAIREDGVYQLPNGKKYRFQQGTVQNVENGALWTLSSSERKKWLNKVASKTWLTFSQIGKIRVGIKTTADDVFIGAGDYWTGDNADLELLKPLITHRNAGQIIGNHCAQWKVLYTHKTENGKKVVYDLDCFPRSKKYLIKYYDRLEERNYVKEAHRKWYEIWVPQDPDAWAHRKIVFSDISERPQFWLDETGAVVNGDCYWIDIYPDVTEDIIYLALAVANSSFIEKYYDLKFNTKLYSGKRRFQTQYVEQFPIPYYATTLAQKAISMVKTIISDSTKQVTLGFKQELDSIVSELFI